MKRNRMAKARASRRGQTTRSSGTSYDFRRNLSNIGLWALGILNVVLVVSFLGKHFFTGDERQISVQDEVGEVPSQAPKIEVLNGCGVQGLARQWADRLHAAGFDPVNVTNFDHANIPRTMIIDRLSNARRNGLAIARALGVAEDYVSYQASDERMVAATVIIGHDYQRFGIAAK